MIIKDPVIKSSQVETFSGKIVTPTNDFHCDNATATICLAVHTIFSLVVSEKNPIQPSVTNFPNKHKS